MRRVTRPVWLALLLLAIGVAVAIVWANVGGGGGAGQEASPAAAAIDTGDARLRGAGLLAEGERLRASDRPFDVVKPERPVSMDPAGPGEVVGQVVDPEGRPVVATLALYVDAVPYGGPFASMTTDASGRFRAQPHKGIGTEWTGVVALTRPRGRTAPLTPTRSGAAPLRIVARLARPARITVVDEAGKGVGIARVRVGAPIASFSMHPRPWTERAEELASWMGLATFTDRSGVAVVTQSPTPASNLTVAGPLDRDLLPATLVGWDGGDATIRMTARPRVEGTVREVDGGLVTDGKVWWRRSGTEEWKNVRVEYDGTFSIDCGEPGAIELCARMQNAFPRPPVASRVVPSGATNVALLTEAGPTLDVRLAGWIDEAMGTAKLIREPADAAGAPHLWVRVDEGRILVRGLDAGAKYTLWVPPLSRVSASPLEVEPGTRCALRTGLVASDDPVSVPLTPVHEVQAKFASPAQTQGWRDVRITVRGHGMFLEVPFEGAWQYDERSYDGEAVLRLPPGPFLIRIEACQHVSTDAQRLAGRLWIRRYAGEAVWETGADRVDVPMAPLTDGPEERRDD